MEYVIEHKTDTVLFVHSLDTVAGAPHARESSGKIPHRFACWDTAIDLRPAEDSVLNLDSVVDIALAGERLDSVDVACCFVEEHIEVEEGDCMYIVVHLLELDCSWVDDLALGSVVVQDHGPGHGILYSKIVAAWTDTYCTFGSVLIVTR